MKDNFLAVVMYIFKTIDLISLPIEKLTSLFIYFVDKLEKPTSFYISLLTSNRVFHNYISFSKGQVELVFLIARTVQNQSLAG